MSSKRSPGQTLGPKYLTHSKLTLYLPPSLATRLRVHGAETGKDLSDIVADSLLKTLPK